MDALPSLLQGFAVALRPDNLFYCLIGCLWGTVVGVLPGLGPLAGLTLLLPLTYQLDPASAVIMLAGIFYGAMYGGSTTSILVRIPGRGGVDHHLHRRPRDGEAGTRRPGARGGRHRQLRRRHRQRRRADAVRAAAGQADAADRPGGRVRPDGAGAAGAELRQRRAAAEDAGDGADRSFDQHGRRRPDHRLPALHVRPASSSPRASASWPSRSASSASARS